MLHVAGVVYAQGLASNCKCLVLLMSIYGVGFSSYTISYLGGWVAFLHISTSLASELYTHML